MTCLLGTRNSMSQLATKACVWAICLIATAPFAACQGLIPAVQSSAGASEAHEAFRLEWATARKLARAYSDARTLACSSSSGSLCSGKRCARACIWRGARAAPCPPAALSVGVYMCSRDSLVRAGATWPPHHLNRGTCRAQVIYFTAAPLSKRVAVPLSAEAFQGRCVGACTPTASVAI